MNCISSSGSEMIEDYLKGKAGFNVPDSMISAVMIDGGIPRGTYVSDLDQRTRELLLADLLYSAITIPSRTGSAEDSDGGWKHKEAEVEFTATDKKIMLQRANELRARWGLNKIGAAKITINAYGIQRVNRIR